MKQDLDAGVVRKEGVGTGRGREKRSGRVTN
jgi:hypothetical protein